jgi:hypothetical protein
MLKRYFGEAVGEEHEEIQQRLTDYQLAAEDKKSAGPDPMSHFEWRRRKCEDADAGWIERRFVLWLTEREKDVLEFACSGALRWTRITARGAAFLAFGLAVYWIGKSRVLSDLGFDYIPAWIGGVIGVIGAIMILPLASGFDRAFRASGYYGIAIAGPALFPIRLTELGRMTMKAAVIRGLVAAPVLVATGITLGVISGSDPASGALLALRLTLCAVFLSPWLVVLGCGSRSNETQSHTFRAARVMLFLFGNSILMLVAGGIALAAPVPANWIALSVFGGLSFLGFLRYRRMYSRGWFDMIQGQK